MTRADRRAQAEAAFLAAHRDAGRRTFAEIEQIAARGLPFAWAAVPKPTSPAVSTAPEPTTAPAQHVTRKERTMPAPARRRAAQSSLVSSSRPSPRRSYVQTRTSWVVGSGFQHRGNNAPQYSVSIDAYALNPLLDDLRQAEPDVYAKASAAGPAPTLFQSGDLPVFTAAGFDAAELLKLPWTARHAAASAESGAEVKRIFDMCAGDPADAASNAAVVADRDGHQGISQYRNRMTNWALAYSELHQALGGTPGSRSYRASDFGF